MEPVMRASNLNNMAFTCAVAVGAAAPGGGASVKGISTPPGVVCTIPALHRSIRMRFVLRSHIPNLCE